MPVWGWQMHIHHMRCEEDASSGTGVMREEQRRLQMPVLFFAQDH